MNIIEEVKQWNTKYKNLSIIALIAMGYFLFNFIWFHIEIVVSPSVEHRVFLKGEGVIESGGYARFTITNDFLPDGATTITKTFGCLPGDVLETKERDHYCNGVWLGVAKFKSKNGEDLPLFDYNGIIPDGMAFMRGSHEDSFDSRYWGFLDLSREDILLMKPLI